MEIYDIAIRIFIAIVVGGAIGYERQRSNRPAGFRTHILVCVGACVVSIIQLKIVEDTTITILANPQLANALKVDIGRMGAQVITGVGFLGAGTIIHEKGLVKGLTTAASVWVVACIGLAIGLGFYYVTLIATISVILSIVLLKKVEKKFIDRIHSIDLSIEYIGDKDFMKSIEKYFAIKNISVTDIELITEKGKKKCEGCTRLIYTIELPKYIKVTNIIQELGRKKDIIQIKILKEKSD